MRSSASRNTIWLPTGGFSRCACSSIQREKLKAASTLERDGEADLPVGAVALAVDAGLAIHVGLVDHAGADVGVAPRLQVNAGACTPGVEVLQSFEVSAPVESADIRFHRVHLMKNVLDRWRELAHLRIRAGPVLPMQADIEPVHHVVVGTQADHQVGFVERVAGARGEHEMRAALGKAARHGLGARGRSKSAGRQDGNNQLDDDHVVPLDALCGARGRNRTGTTLRSGDFKSPASTSFATQAAALAGILPLAGESGGGSRNRTGVHGFACRCMTTLPSRHKQRGKARRGETSGPPSSCESGAGNESRTRDLNLGKVALYQLSYSRVACQL